MANLHIEGRRWRDSYGNTYHSVRVFSDGEEIGYLPFQYGYGDQYIQTALDWLKDSGNMPSLRHDAHVTGGGTLFLREALGASYSVVDVGRKKDL